MNIANLSADYSTPELLLIYVILSLLGLNLVLLAATIFIRLYDNRANRILKRKQDIWEEAVLEFISSDVDYNTLTAPELYSIRLKEFQSFGQFIEDYLVNLKGEEYDKIIRLLRNIGYDILLLKALDKTDKWGKAYAAHFLGLMDCQRAESKLLELLNSRSPILYLSSFEALSRIASSANESGIVRSLIAKKTVERTKIIELLLGFGNSINPVLIGLLSDGSLTPAEKRLIVDLLSARSIMESSQAILELAESTDDMELKIACIKAFGTFEDPEGLPFLTASLNSKNWVLRSQAAKAIGRIGHEEALPLLKDKLLHDPKYWVRLYSAISMKNMSSAGRDELNKIREQSDSKAVNSFIDYVLHETENN
jgi:HEAT repeat protein